jgi:hypothetical protein
MDVLVELFKSDGLSVISSNCVNHLQKLLITESVLELFVDVFQLINSQLSPSLEVVQTKVGSSSFFAERVSLHLNQNLRFLP